MSQLASSEVGGALRWPLCFPSSAQGGFALAVYRNSTSYTSWLPRALIKNRQGDRWVRSRRCSALHLSTRSRPVDVRQCQTRPAISARVVGPPGRFHKHNNPFHIPPAMFLCIENPRGCLKISSGGSWHYNNVFANASIVETPPSLGRRQRGVLYLQIEENHSMKGLVRYFIKGAMCLAVYRCIWWPSINLRPTRPWYQPLRRSSVLGSILKGIHPHCNTTFISGSLHGAC